MLLLLAVGLLCQRADAQNERPNILLIVADDLGFSDLGCYGGEIDTPNLNRLANDGVRLTQFYTTGRCCPSRASILTGLYPHAVGLGHMTKDIGRPGYRGQVSADVPVLAERLEQRGYRCYLSGKWHLGTDNPTERGFEEFYGTLVSAKTFWDPDHFLRMSRAAPSSGKGDQPGRKDAPGQDDFYGTDALADHAIQFLQQARSQSEAPWFLYLAFNAPHFPLHAPAETIAKYADRYHGGWDQLRKERLQRMKKLGLVDQETRLTPRSPFYDWAATEPHENPAWASLPVDRRKDLARRMAIYAAMVDRMDQNIGRVLSDLDRQGELDNTLTIFTSDNGACAEWDAFGFDIKSGPQNILHRGDQIDRMGSKGTYHSVGSGWANASNTPWRLYKHFNHEGGIAVPCILRWPAGQSRPGGEIEATPTHLIDLVPTLLDATSQVSAQQQTSPDGRRLPGESLLPLLDGQPLADRKLYFEHEGNRAVRDGRWKLVALRNQPWELYDLSTDRTEQHNLAAQHPDIVRRLEQAWNDWAEQNNVTPLPDDYEVQYLPAVSSDSDRKDASPKNKVPEPMGEVRKLSDGFRFTEGPAWDGRSNWYFSDLPNRKLYRWNESDGTQLVRTGTDGFSNGIVVDDRQRLIFCEVPTRRIIRRTPAGEESVLADSCNGRPIGMPNDLWLAPNSDVYFTIPRTNRQRAKVVPENAVHATVCLIRLSEESNNAPSKQAAASTGPAVTDVGVGLKSPNGIVGTSDGSTLFVADPGSRKCWRFTIRPDGRLKNRQLAADRGSDGLAVDEFGNLYVTGTDGVLIYSPDAKKIASIPVPERPANMKFGGADNRTLFITAGTGIYSVEMNVHGN